MNILSIKELNDTLKFFQDKRRGNTKSFVEQYKKIKFDYVDIGFIAGLMLDYETNKNDKWERRKIDFLLSKDERGNDKNYEIKQYFQQYKELYDVDWEAVFIDFSYAPKKETPNTYSSSFVPIIYINEQNKDNFFSYHQEENRIEKLKMKYIEQFKQRVSSYSDKDYEKQFFNAPDSIIKDLDTQSPIFSFIYIVAYSKIVDRNRKNIKKESFSVWGNKIWQFTQEYVSGLNELAKNIIDHSTTKQGMITIRAYSQDEIDKTRILETHVFDFGKIGIIPQLYEYTKTQCEDNNIVNNEIKEAYINDLKRLKEDKDFNLKKLILPEKGKELEQQIYRYIRHYGINNVKCLAIDNFKGKICISTNRNLADERENWQIYSNNESEAKMEIMDEKAANEETLSIGTSYHLYIPLITIRLKK